MFIKIKKNYADALKDGNDAIKLDETNVKAYIRKGVSLYNQDLKEEPLEVFFHGLEFDSTDDQLKIWRHKCEKELAGMIFFSDSINIHTKIPSSGQDYSLEVDLAYPIDSSRTNFNATGSNLEIKLYKRQAIQRMSLDAQSTAAKVQSPVPMSRPLVENTPSYPSSSLHAKNWDKLEAEIKRDEKENTDDIGDANAIFQRLDQYCDENTRRAMNKSMYESGGTCLSMNWEEVSKSRVTCEPPDVSLFI
ncbi:unnamed protein product [Rotaria sp. Silwood2]|nr:unnamed protein product [Rotaria sp. Silwood2]